MLPPFLRDPLDPRAGAARTRLLDGIPQGPAPRAASPGPRRAVFRTIREETPGERWASHFARHWPAYRAWFLAEGSHRRPSLAETARALRVHTPEIVPTWRALCGLAGGGEEAGRFLGLWGPAPFLSHCSQVALAGPDPALARNYDYRPDLLEGTVLLTRWGSRRVLAMSDCAWGALDGMNEDGLAVSLSFGGRRIVGEGFGIPLVLRYLLETCPDAGSAVAALRRLPVHMAYNVTLADRAGSAFTVFVAPGEEASVREDAVAANHQAAVEWEEHARATRSVEREGILRRLRASGAGGNGAVADAFLRPPLFSTAFDRGWGTLYTAVYRPARGTMELLWPDGGWRLSFEEFPERERAVDYAAGA